MRGPQGPSEPLNSFKMLWTESLWTKSFKRLYFLNLKLYILKRYNIFKLMVHKDMIHNILIDFLKANLENTSKSHGPSSSSLLLSLSLLPFILFLWLNFTLLKKKPYSLSLLFFFLFLILQFEMNPTLIDQKCLHCKNWNLVSYFQ